MKAFCELEIILPKRRLQPVSENLEDDFKHPTDQTNRLEILYIHSTCLLGNKRNKCCIKNLLKLPSTMKFRYPFSILPTLLKKSHSEAIQSQGLVTIRSPHHLPRLLLLKLHFLSNQVLSSASMDWNERQSTHGHQVHYSKYNWL
jgi:hypothetical protein